MSPIDQAQDNANQEPPLAGTQCPHCDAVCVYQPPADAQEMGITTVDIACHACGHIFETALPETSLSGAAIAVTDPDTADIARQDMAETEAPTKQKKTPKKPKSSGGWLKKTGVIFGLALLGTAGVIGTGVILNPPVKQRSLEEQFSTRKVPAKPKNTAPKTDPVNTDTSKIDETPIKASSAPKQEAPKQAVPQKEIKIPITPAVFASHHAGFTLAENDLGQVMTINFSVTNDGGSPGLPTALTVYLIDSQGQIIMSWPMDVGTRPFGKNETRSFTIEVVEPPENITSVEVDIQ